MQVICPDCRTTLLWSPVAWRCACGGALESAEEPFFDSASIDPKVRGLWRYSAFLPVPSDTQQISMGEGWTPLVDGEFESISVRWKLEFLNPTGSFKDRGTAPLMTALKSWGVQHVVEDSSGNAGASAAAYSARAGMKATIFVPAHASPSKLAQIGIYGGRVVSVPGPRVEATRAAEAALTTEVAYASHVWQPTFLAGLQTLAWEIWEQLDGRAPEWLIAPVGQGTLLLGAYRGFRVLLEAGHIQRLPRMVAAQAERCAPLYAAWREGLDHVPSVQGSPTAAEGIRITCPVRGRELLQAIGESGGAVLRASEDQIRAAQSALARRGLYVEPTSAVAVACLDQLRSRVGRDDVVVVPLTGSGLKGAPVDLQGDGRREQDDR